MNLNKSLITKIDTIVNLTNEFDKLFNSILNFQDMYKQNNNEQNNNESNNNEPNNNEPNNNKPNNNEQNKIEQIYALTKNYIFLRSEHGGLLMLLDKLKNNINSVSTELSDELVNKLYDLSTFNSIINNVSELINNIDFQYKKIALKYPKYISRKPITIILFVEKIDPNNNYIKMIEEVKNLNLENIYKVIECGSNKKIKCNEILGKNISIKLDKVPSIFIINDDNIIEIPIEHVKNVKSLLNLIN